jgi:hypothetical protein
LGSGRHGGRRGIIAQARRWLALGPVAGGPTSWFFRQRAHHALTVDRRAGRDIAKKGSLDHPRKTASALATELAVVRRLLRGGSDFEPAFRALGKVAVDRLGRPGIKLAQAEIAQNLFGGMHQSRGVHALTLNSRVVSSTQRANVYFNMIRIRGHAAKSENPPSSGRKKA